MVKRILGIILLTAFVILPSTTAFAEGNSPGNLYYIGRVGEEEHIVIPYTTTNGEHGFLGIDSVNNVYSDERQPDTRADGDPVLPYTTYKVWFWSPMTYIYYYVDTDGNSLFTNVHDLYYITVHNITYHSLSCTTTRAHLYLEWIYFNTVGSANGYVDYVIIDGCLYFQTNL